jgi:hypothetical protein
VCNKYDSQKAAKQRSKSLYHNTSFKQSNKLSGGKTPGSLDF